MSSVEPLIEKTAQVLPARIPHVVAITSGKGGVGKSSISVNLGIALARMGRKVCIFDADTGLANINILLGLTPQFGVEHVLYGTKSIEEIMLNGPHDLKVIPGANGIVECVNLPPRQQLHLTRALADVENAFDYMLVDTAAGIAETTLDFVQAAQQTLIVITPEPTSLTDAFSMLKLLQRRGKRSDFHVVVNMCANANQGREVFHRFAAAVEKYIHVPLNFLGYIQQDESMRAAVTMQSPVALFAEDDPSCRNFFRLGRALEDALTKVRPVASFAQYWQGLYRRRRLAAKSAASPQHRSAKTGGAVSQSQLRHYLNELRARMLTLMAQGSLPPEDFSALIDELSVAMRTNFRFEPVKVPTRTDNSAHSLEHDCASESPSESIKSEPTRAAITHGFDEQRYGSQQLLLDRLRCEPDLPLVDLVTQLTAS